MRLHGTSSDGRSVSVVIDATHPRHAFAQGAYTVHVVPPIARKTDVSILRARLCHESAVFFSIDGDPHVYLLCVYYRAWESMGKWVVVDAQTGRPLTQALIPLGGWP
jgi:hypothetical protein